MSEPTHSSNVQIITNGDMTTTINSSVTNLDEIVSYSVQAIFTGSPLGTLQLQGSNDVPIIDSAVVNWTIITPSISAVSGAGSYLINVEFPAYSWVRLQYVPTSGSGTLNARIDTKRR
jgi:hypothetical protein